MKLPVDRGRLAARNALDAESDRAELASMTPAERLAIGISLSNVSRALGIAAGAAWVTADASDLAQKAVVHVRLMRCVRRRDP